MNEDKISFSVSKQKLLSLIDGFVGDSTSCMADHKVLKMTEFFTFHSGIPVLMEYVIEKEEKIVFAVGKSLEEQTWSCEQCYQEKVNLEREKPITWNTLPEALEPILKEFAEELIKKIEYRSRAIQN